MDAERTLDRFEAAWQRGDPPDIAEFVDFAAVWSRDPEARQSLLVELVMIDLWYRWRRTRHGPARVPAAAGAALQGRTGEVTVDALPERPLLEDYVRRYPELGPLEELPPIAIGEEYRARRQWGDRPTHADYAARFRSQADEVDTLLSQIDRELADDTVASRETSTSEGTPAGAGDDSSAGLRPPPSVIGKYHVIGVLEEGGQAQVYRAIHPTLSKELVIKLGRRPLGSRPTDQLVAEGKLLAELEHPNLARVYDMDFHENRPYLVMEYVRGRNLRHCARQHRYTPREAALLMSKIARALALPHARGIVHQDLKPGNIIIDESGEPRVIDFGLARLLPAWVDEPEEAPGSISGTVQYMPPEQARGDHENVDPRSDVFALGAVLYFLLVGRAPFVDDSVMASLDRARRCDFDREALRRAKVPRALEAVCLRAMQAEPDARYASVEAMACDLERAAAGPRCFQRVVGAVAATAAVALLAFGLWKLWPDGAEPPRPLPQPHEREKQWQRLPKIEPADMAREVLGRSLRNDFTIEFEVIGHPAGDDNSVRMIDGQYAAFRLRGESDCFVGIWLVTIGDGETVVSRLFPNEHERDHFLAAGEPRTVPDESAPGFRVTPSAGAEYLHVVAYSKRWAPPLGPEQGFVTPEQMVEWEVRVKGIEMTERQSPPIAETLVRLHVRENPEAANRQEGELEAREE